MKSKQVIVMRKDLNMRKGKMVAQGAHASLKVFLDRQITTSNEGFYRTYEMTSQSMIDWIEGSFTKICLGADSEAELDELYEKAKAAGLPCSMIVDNGLTEFNGIKTKTCIAIGPADSDSINNITGYLKPL